MPPLPPRRLVVGSLVVLVAAALPLAAPVSGVQADEPCLTEVVTGTTLSDPGSRCDDANAPETRLTDAEPYANRRGYLAQDTLRIDFAGSHVDTDADPITFECQLYRTPAPPAEWEACSSPITYTGLDETEETPYTFRARAVDEADRNIDATAGGGLFQPTPAPTDLPDLDETPSAVSFYVDTIAPNTFVFDGPYDQVTPEFPMSTQRHPQVELTSNEPDAVFTCSVSGRPVACETGGRTTLRGLRPGDHVLRVAATDPAGNTDPTPTTMPFSLPRNLGPRHGQGWTKVRARGDHYAGDYLASTRRGSTLTVRARNAGELRVVAPTGRRLGRLEIQVGAQASWVPLDQVSADEQSFAVVYQRFFGRKFTGKISIRALRARTSRPALVDAVLLH